MNTITRRFQYMVVSVHISFAWYTFSVSQNVVNGRFVFVQMGRNM